MKKLLSLMVMAVMLLSILPMVVADEDDVSGGITIDIGDPNEPPVIFLDNTQRSWYPNDQTYYTAELYSDGGLDNNNYCRDFYDVGMRGDYVFAGETVRYYTLVQDPDGDSDIDSVNIRVFGAVGANPADTLINTACVELDPTTDLGCGGPFWVDGVTTLDQFGTVIDPAVGPNVFDDATMNLYECILIVPTTTDVIDAAEVSIEATDRALTAQTDSIQNDILTINPPLQVELGGTGFAFGSAEAGTTVTSSTVQLTNVGSHGVVMDMYTASDDYFTDPSGTGTCGAFGPGIPYTSFSYYASKGSVDSGDNNNAWPGLGETAGGLCVADLDEYTPMPSNSGDIWDMCRIINHQIDSSGLTQGQSMNVRIQLDIPTECEGSFTNGQFHFVGRVV